MNQSHRRNRGHSPLSRKTILSSLRSMFDWSSCLVLLGPCLFLYQTFYIVQHAACFRAVLLLTLSLLFCLVFAATALLAEHWLDRLAGIFRLRCSRILSVFLLFFILLVGYLLLTSSLISAPMGLVLAKSSFSPASINRFALQNSNCALGLALLSWLRRLIPLVRKTQAQPAFPYLRFTDH